MRTILMSYSDTSTLVALFWPAAMHPTLIPTPSVQPKHQTDLSMFFLTPHSLNLRHNEPEQEKPHLWFSKALYSVRLNRQLSDLSTSENSFPGHLAVIRGCPSSPCSAYPTHKAKLRCACKLLPGRSWVLSQMCIFSESWNCCHQEDTETLHASGIARVTLSFLHIGHCRCPLLLQNLHCLSIWSRPSNDVDRLLLTGKIPAKLKSNVHVPLTHLSDRWSLRALHGLQHLLWHRDPLLAGFQDVAGPHLMYEVVCYFAYHESVTRTSQHEQLALDTI